MVCHRKPPSQTWRTFLENRIKTMVSVDFFTVPMIRFPVLYVFLVLAHDRRRILHFAVTAPPTAKWTAQHLREAFPWDTAPRYLLRNRGRIFEREFVGYGDQRGAVGTAFPLAASLCRTGHRLRPTRVLGPRHRVRRRELVPSPAKFRGRLSSEPDAPGIGEGLFSSSPRPIGGHGAGYCDAGSRRTASSLLAPRPRGLWRSGHRRCEPTTSRE